MLKAILRFFQPKPAQPEQAKVTLTPHKHAILQARINAYREKLEAARLEAMESGARRRVNDFISRAEEAVDKAFYAAGMC